MAAYLSKIVARFDGSGVDSTTKNKSSTQALMPSRIAFGSHNAIDTGHPTATFSNEFTFPDFIYSSDDESFSDDKKMLKPFPNYITSSPVETIRSLFHSEDNITQIEQESFKQNDLNVPQKKIILKSNSVLQQSDENDLNVPQKVIPKSYSALQQLNENNNLKLNKKEDVTDFNSNNSQIDKEDSSSTSFQKNQRNDKKIHLISPNKKKKKEPLTLETKSISKENNPKELQPNFSFDTIGQKEKGQTIINRLKPSIKKRLGDTTPRKKHTENKIRIGSIRVEILPAKPKKVKTRTQQIPQQKNAAPSKSSGNQSRFPLRFGLKQM